MWASLGERRSGSYLVPLVFHEWYRMTILTPPRPITHQAPRLTPRSDAQPTLEAWRVVGWVGIAFVVMGFTDVALAWYPTAFGNPEWEFGAISATLNGFALPTLGLYLVLA